MTELLEKAISEVRKLSSEQQDEAAEILLSVVEHRAEAIQLTAEQQAEMERRLRDFGESIPHDQVRAYFRQLAG